MPRGDKKLPGGATISRGPGINEYAPDGYTVAWPDGSTAEVDIIGTWGLRLFLAPADTHKGRLTGLLGNFDGKADNDLVARDGKPVPQPPEFEQLYRTFGDGWRIAQADSLFDYAPGESTEKFTDRTFPERPLTVDSLPEALRNHARAACLLAGVSDASLLDQCIIDVALTGQPSFAVNAADTQTVLPEPAPGPVNPGGTVRDGDVVKGKIDSSGERDVYQLDLGDAKEFQFVEQTGEISIAAEVTGAWKRGLATDADEFIDSSPAARRVVVSKSDNATGEYSFRVVAHKHRRFAVKPGDRIGPGGVPGSGRLDVPGRVDVYQLDPGPAKTIELADSRGCDYSVGVAEDTPDSSVLAPYPVWPNVPTKPDGPCFSIPIDIEPNKPVLLVVWSNAAKTLDYEFRIQPKN